MPLIQIATSVELDDAQVDALAQEICAVVGTLMNKPEEYIMVTALKAHIEFGRAEDPAAFVDFRSIGGLSRETNGKLTQRISAILEAHLGVPAGRIYLTFTDVPPTHWGWNGTTFG